MLLCNVVFCSSEQTSESELHDRHFFFGPFFFFFLPTLWKSTRNPVRVHIVVVIDGDIENIAHDLKTSKACQSQSKWLMQKRISHTILSSPGTPLHLASGVFTYRTPPLPLPLPPRTLRLSCNNSNNTTYRDRSIDRLNGLFPFSL